jgi:hypothetical protein
MSLPIALFVLAVHTVPLAAGSHGSIAVQTMVDGRGPYTFLIDTGAAATTVRSGVARDCGESLVAKTEVVSSAGRMWRGMARFRTISVGEVSAVDILSVIIPDRELHQLAGDVDGILGQDFLRQHPHLIDYERRVLVFDEAPPDGGIPVRLVTREGRILMALRGDRNAAMLLVPDSGSDTLVLFDGAPVYRTTQLASLSLSTLTHTRDAARVLVPLLRVAATTFRNVTAITLPRNDTGTDGLLPLSMFRRVWFDANHEQMIVWR